jgi:hypothetical protein
MESLLYYFALLFHLIILLFYRSYFLHLVFLFLIEYLERGCMTCNICGSVDLNNLGQVEFYI